jgi:hypothetical protein
MYKRVIKGVIPNNFALLIGCQLPFDLEINLKKFARLSRALLETKGYQAHGEIRNCPSHTIKDK